MDRSKVGRNGNNCGLPVLAGFVQYLLECMRVSGFSKLVIRKKIGKNCYEIPS